MENAGGPHSLIVTHVGSALSSPFLNSTMRRKRAKWSENRRRVSSHGLKVSHRCLRIGFAQVGKNMFPGNVKLGWLDWFDWFNWSDAICFELIWFDWCDLIDMGLIDCIGLAAIDTCDFGWVDGVDLPGLLDLGWFNWLGWLDWFDWFNWYDAIWFGLVWFDWCDLIDVGLIDCIGLAAIDTCSELWAKPYLYKTTIRHHKSSKLFSNIPNTLPGSFFALSSSVSSNCL
jgi:hypothetical protein